MLQHDPHLKPVETARLRICDHPAAMFLSAAIRDPDPPDDPNSDDGLIIVTPRWLSDTAGPQRMYFAVHRRTNKDVFDRLIEPFLPIRVEVEGRSPASKIVGPITATLFAEDKKLGVRTIDQVCNELGLAD
jgi:hypothetical protein